jgi:hypothetical protein
MRLAVSARSTNFTAMSRSGLSPDCFAWRRARLA